MPRPDEDLQARLPTRREALRLAAGVTALTVAPWLGLGCRRRSPTAPTPPAQPRNLDDVGDLATFRPPIPASEPAVRVRVMRVRNPASPPLRLGADGQWLMLRVQGSDSLTVAADGSRPIALQGPIEVGMTSRGWSIADGKGFRASVPDRAAFALAPSADADDPLIAVRVGTGEAREYRGALRLVSRHDLDSTGEDARASQTSPSSCFDLINDVPIETYLPGVLAGELYAAWHPETFAAQAIAARSFAATECAVFAGRRHYDVTNTASSQMYLGVVGNARAIDAVQRTRGRMLAYDNLLVSGYYSSCCGGLAATATDAIGSNPVNDAPPLRGRSGSDVCTEAPVYRWRVEQLLDDLLPRLAAYGRERGMKDLAAFRRLADVRIAARNPHGRPTRFALADDRGQRIEITAEHFRRAANFGTSDGAVKPPSRELRSSHLTATVTNSRAIFDGNGFGHGVGLCQHGAQTLAVGGMAHDDIVRWYYPDVTMVAAYA